MGVSAVYDRYIFLALFLVVPVGYFLVIWRLRSRGRPAEQDVGNLCGKCGYSVRGLTTFICPECGSDLREVGINKPPPRPRKSVILFVIALVMAGLAFLGVMRFVSMAGPATPVRSLVAPAMNLPILTPTMLNPK